MAEGNYDHPAYTARFYMSTANTIAGANGTSGSLVFPNAVRIRKARAIVVTAGTSGTTGTMAIILNGTSTAGSVALGTAAAQSTFAIADMNSALAADTLLSVKNGTDATQVIRVVYEIHGDPAGSFT